MTMTTPSIYVVNAITKRSGRLAYTGFVVTGPELRVGDVFRVRYELPSTSEERRLGMASLEPARIAAVSLKVDEIYAMRGYVEALWRGVTGNVFLSGDGLDSVTEGTLLCTSLDIPLIRAE
jgi:hypothetical protein